MRTPKLRGFHNKWRKRFAVLNLTRLNRFEDGTEVRPESLLEAGIVKDVGAGIKVLGTGDLRRKLTIHAHRFSAEAKRKIEAAGGTAAVIEVPPPIRAKTKRAKNQPKPVRPADKAEAAEAAEATEAPQGEKPKRGEKAEKVSKGRPAGASTSEDSSKPEKGKKKS